MLCFLGGRGRHGFFCVEIESCMLSTSSLILLVVYSAGRGLYVEVSARCVLPSEM